LLRATKCAILSSWQIATKESAMYDVIGDVHGQGGKLRALLAHMG
jgi:hypothetical protein